jgi:hypothetical protein
MRVGGAGGRWRGLGVLLVTLTMGCGDLTESGVGEVEVYAVADGSQPSGAPEGLLAVQLQVFLQADDGAQWTEVTSGVRDLTLELRGSERRVAVRFLGAGRFTRLRVSFQRVVAEVSGGLLVEGGPITGTVAVDLGPSGELVVEREILLEVRRDGAADLVLDFNADLWLPAVSPLTRSVPGAVFADALAVRIR